MQLSHALAYAIRGCASDVHRTSPTFIRCLLASYWQQLAPGRFCRSNMQILNIPKWSWPHLTSVRVAPTEPDLHTIMPIYRLISIQLNTIAWSCSDHVLDRECENGALHAHAHTHKQNGGKTYTRMHTHTNRTEVRLTRACTHTQTQRKPFIVYRTEVRRTQKTIHCVQLTYYPLNFILKNPCSTAAKDKCKPIAFLYFLLQAT